MATFPCSEAPYLPVSQPMSPLSKINVSNNKIQKKKPAFKHSSELMWGKNVSFHMGFQSDMLISVSMTFF